MAGLDKTLAILREKHATSNGHGAPDPSSVDKPLDALKALRRAETAPNDGEGGGGAKRRSGGSTARLPHIRNRRYAWISRHSGELTPCEVRVALRIVETCAMAGYGGTAVELAAALGVEVANARRALYGLCRKGFLLRKAHERRKVPFYVFRVK